MYQSCQRSGVLLRRWNRRSVKAGAEVHLSANYGDVKGNGIIGGVAGRVSTTGMYSNGSAKECAVYDVYNLGQVSGYGTTAGSEMGGT